MGKRAKENFAGAENSISTVADHSSVGEGAQTALSGASSGAERTPTDGQAGCQAWHDRFEGFAEVAFEGLVVHEGGRIIECNEKFAEMFGYTPEEIKGADGFAMLSPCLVGPVREKIESGWEGVYESCFKKKDGTIFPVEVRVKEATLDGRRVRAAAIRDLTPERRQSQQLKAVFESSQDCILVWDREYNYLYANQAAIDHVKTTREKVIGKNIRDGLGHIPDFMRLWMDRIDEVFRTGAVKRVEDAVMVGDKLVYSESVLSPIRYPDGEMFAVGVVYRDITERKQLLKELEASRQRYRDLYNHAQVALFVSDVQGLLLDCNLQTLEFFGYSRDEPQENYIRKVCVTDYYTDPERRHEFVRELQRHGQVRGFEAELKRADGKLFWASVSARLVPESGTIEGALYDITAAKVLTEAEKKVLSNVLQGKSNKEIAYQLHRSIRTIEDHRAHIMQKLGVRNLVELVQKAGLTELELDGIDS